MSFPPKTKLKWIEFVARTCCKSEGVNILPPHTLGLVLAYNYGIYGISQMLVSRPIKSELLKLIEGVFMMPLMFKFLRLLTYFGLISPTRLMLLRLKYNLSDWDSNIYSWHWFVVLSYHLLGLDFCYLFVKKTPMNSPFVYVIKANVFLLT